MLQDLVVSLSLMLRILCPWVSKLHSVISCAWWYPAKLHVWRVRRFGTSLFSCCVDLASCKLYYSSTRGLLMLIPIILHMYFILA